MPAKKPTSLATTTPLAPEIAKKLYALKGRATKLLNTWKEPPVVTDTTSFETVGAGVKDAVSIRKELHDLLDPVVKAAKAEVKAKERLYKDVDALLTAVETSLRTPLETYAAQQRAAQAKKVEAALERGNDVKAAAAAAKPYVPDVQGLSFSEHWHAEVTNLHDFVAWCLSGSTEKLEGFLMPNLVALNARARDLKAEDLQIPGVKGVKETSSNVHA
jgi:hypothetical protein